MPTIKKASDIHWMSIIESLEADKCILVLGDGMLFSGEGKEKTNVLKKLKSEVLLMLKEHSKNYQPSYELCDLGFLINVLRGEFNGSLYWTQLKRKFLQGDPPNSLYKKIAEIPFSLVLSTSPDNFLKSELNTMQLPCQKGFLKHKGKKDFDINATISSKDPAIFSLFGNIDDPDSLVMDNYNNTTRLISSLYKGENKLPPKVIEKINEASHCIFLGVDFEDWYTNILLDILQFNKHNIEKKWSANYAFSAFREVDESTEHFYEDNFNIGFICIEKFDLRRFVEDLHKEIKKHDKKLIRVKNDNPGKLYIAELNRIREHLVTIPNLKLTDILDSLIDLVCSEDLNIDHEYQRKFSEQLDVQEGLFSGIKDDKISNTVETEKLLVRFNNIKDSLRLICNGIEKAIDGG